MDHDGLAVGIGIAVSVKLVRWPFVRRCVRCPLRLTFVPSSRLACVPNRPPSAPSSEATASQERACPSAAWVLLPPPRGLIKSKVSKSPQRLFALIRLFPSSMG